MTSTGAMLASPTVIAEAEQPEYASGFRPSRRKSAGTATRARRSWGVVLALVEPRLWREKPLTPKTSAVTGVEGPPDDSLALIYLCCSDLIIEIPR